MKDITTNARSSAIISFILALPLPILLSIAVLTIEPFYGLLTPLFTEANGYRNSALGLTILIGAFLLLPVAFIVSVAPIGQTMRTGGSLLAHPINLVLAVAILVFITTIVGSIIIDQYPCWIGVPNCD